jgi:hypothetical protein
MKQQIIIVAAITLIVIAGSAFLFRKGKNIHGFNRSTRGIQPAKLKKVIAVPGTYYIAGLTKDTFFFHTASPQQLYYTDTALERKGMIKLDMNDSLAAELRIGFHTDVHPPYADVYAYNQATILRYHLDSHQLYLIQTPNNFTNAVRLSDSVFLLKCFEGTSPRLSYCKLNVMTHEVTHTPDTFHADLASGGTLLYDTSYPASVFVHFYSNCLLTIGENMAIQQAFHTIDTFKGYTVNYLAAKGSSGGTVYKPRGERMIINRLTQIEQGRLYINSLIKADNERDDRAEHYDVLDVYDLWAQKYLNSIYIPVLHGLPMQDFRISGKRIIVTYRSYIALYEL